ncbi:hypothetical protein [Wenyingzhuangia marina]|uniref:Chaperone of endosialidase n=1 Tax=Wenyingzhuangia marina TaxID=1195760 RepID=A0A1M5RYL5_9FLAO|nr:hypothetical protein [Wenyingzhuangia marina]SHH31128.1 hypothetical protein SAMN05444281_0023 [Wenyingzhuangia marina]
MKKRILLIAFIGITFGLNAQITDTGSNVGIGTTSPTVKLDIASDSFGLPATSGSTPNGFLRIGYIQRSWGGTEILSGIINDYIYDYAGYIQAKNPIDYSQNRTFLINPQGGKVGIGTTTPKENLSVYGINARLSVTGASGSSAILLGNQNGGGVNNPAAIYGANGNLYFGGGTSWSGGGTLSPTMIVKDNMKVGIGTLNPDSLLTVNGKIHATEVLVDTNIFADYVFKENYNLKPLSQVEDYIKSNGHLEGFKSEKEIVKEGVNLKEVTIKQQEKIEELTLYLIELSKEVKSLKAQLNKE